MTISKYSKLVSFGYHLNLIVPRDKLPELVEILLDCYEADSQEAKAKITPIQYEVYPIPEGMGEPLSDREKKLIADAAENSTRWYKEYIKNQELEKELRAMRENQQQQDEYDVQF